MVKGRCLYAGGVTCILFRRDEVRSVARVSVCLCCDVYAAFVKILRSRSCVFGCKGVDLVVFFDVERKGGRL